MLEKVTVYKDYSLSSLNSFGLKATAANYALIKSENELLEIIKSDYSPLSVLGGGSNVLITQKVKGILLRNGIVGKSIVSEDDETVIIGVGGGENWHEFVLWTLENDYGGLENLSLIPGTVGAAPIQNIGAYGVEQKDHFIKLEAVHLETGDKYIFTNEECAFGYRDSVFKGELKGQLFITRVYYQLTRKNHKLNNDYGAIKTTLAAKGIDEPSIQDLSNAIIEIRQSKLPDPKEIGNAGSFFKNPVVPEALYKRIKLRFEKVPAYPLGNGEVKIPAGWLIEKCGWKGKRFGDVGCHKNQALVLVNFGEATGTEILDLSKRIMHSVKEEFAIELNPEVNIW